MKILLTTQGFQFTLLEVPEEIQVQKVSFLLEINTILPTLVTT